MQKATIRARHLPLALALALLACALMLLAPPTARAWAADSEPCGWAYLVSLSTSSGDDEAGYRLELQSTQRLDDAGFVDLGPIRDGEAVPWENRAAEIEEVAVLDRIAPASTASWFSGCSSLRSLDLALLDTSNVRSMYSMFYGCSSLKSVDLSSFDTSNVMDMGEMFAHCGSLESPDLSSFGTGQVTSMNAMFWMCISLSSLDLSSFDTSKVDSFSMMFLDCRSLSSLDLSSFDASAASDTSGMLEGCLQLRTMAIGPKLTLDADEAFDEQALFGSGQTWVLQGDPSVVCESWDELVAYVQKSGSPAWFSRQIGSSLSGESGSCVWELDEAGKLAIRPKQGVSGELGAWEDEPPWSAFAWHITSVEFQEKIYAQTCRGMFGYCMGLKSIDFSGLDTSQVTDMSGMFYECGKAFSEGAGRPSIVLSGLDTSSVEDMSGMFQDAWLESLDLSGLDTAQVTDMSAMFQDCLLGSSLDLSGFDTSSLEDASCMFSGFGFFDTSKLPSLEPLGGASLDLSSFDASHMLTENMLSSGDGLTELRVGEQWMFWSDMGFESGAWLAPDGDVYRSDDLPSCEGTYSRVSWGNGECTCATLSEDGALTLRKCDPTEMTEDTYVVNTLGYASSGEVPWAARRSEIKTVFVDGSTAVDSVAHWFEGCANLASADLSQLEMRSSIDAASLFDGCCGLVSVVLPAGMPLSRASGMFRFCSSLATIENMGSATSSKVVDFSEVFRSCSSLVSLDLSGFDTRNATSMKRMLHECRALEQVTLGPQFTFRGAAWSRLAGSELPVGAWRQVGGDEGRAYASDSLPSFAPAPATYVKVPEADLAGYTIESLRGDTKDSSRKYTVETELTGDAESGYTAEETYIIDDDYGSDIGDAEAISFVIGDSAQASSTLPTITGTKVKAQTVRRVITGKSKIKAIVIGPRVESIEAYAFKDCKDLRSLQVRSAKLKTQKSVAKCLAKSEVRVVSIPTRYVSKAAKANVKKAFMKWSKPKRKCTIN